VRALRWIFGLSVAIVITYFAIANRHIVDVHWSPFHAPVPVPLYLPVVIMTGAGFFTGSLMIWLGTLPSRLAAWKQERKLRKLEKQMQEFQQAEPVNETGLPMVKG